MKQIPRQLLFALAAISLSVAAVGCSPKEEPQKSAGYYDGKMTPAGGGKTQKGSAQ